MNRTREMARWMLGIIFVLLIVIIGTLVFALVGGKGLQSITISPQTPDTELDVGQVYYITVSTDPAGEKISKFKYEADSTCVTFENADSSTAILTTQGEGQVTVFVSKGKIESNRLTFSVVDKAARQAEEEAKRAEEEAKKAEEEARLAAEEAAKAEEEAESAELAEVTGDDVNIRSDATKDSEALGKASKGERFTKVEDKDGWTGIDYNGKTGYIRNDFVKVGTEEELGEAKTSEKKDDEKKDDKKEENTEEKKDDKKDEKKDDKKEEVKNTESNNDEAKKAEEAAKKAEEEAKKAEEAAKKAQEEAAQQLAAQQAAAAAAAPAAGGSLPASGPWTYGGITFTASQVAYFHSLWDYTGDAAEYASHHPAGELLTLCQNSNVQ